MVSTFHLPQHNTYGGRIQAGLSSTGNVNVLSRPMQRKLVMLINCQLLEEEGRTRALKAARSLGERTVTELIIQHQNPQQLSTNLWAAVRARGCQFLGPGLGYEIMTILRRSIILRSFVTTVLLEQLCKKKS